MSTAIEIRKARLINEFGSKPKLINSKANRVFALI
jgi:hypothetical protein